MMEFDAIAGYDVVSVLGHGARSTIYAVTDDKNQVYALKRVVKKDAKDQRFLDQAIREHEVASQFDHALLRRSYKLIRQRALIRTNEVLVLMELVDGVPLDRTASDDILQMLEWAREVALGLGVMHKEGYVHSDMKPNNVLVLKDGTVKLIDFGQSCKTGTIKERIQGTPDYIAPEQVLRRQITPQTDVFNLGAMLYWLLTGRHVPTLIPKREVTAVALKTEDNEFAPPDQLNPQVSPALATLVMQCLDPEPKQRPENMKNVVDRLEIATGQIAKALGRTPGAVEYRQQSA